MPKLSINIDVDDLEKAVEFYSAAVGLTPLRRFGASAVELTGAEVPVYLLHKRPGTLPFEQAPSGRDYGRHWTPVHVDFMVERIDEAVRRAVEAGAAIESEVESHAWGRIALMADPFGNGFCLLQLEAAGYQAMTTPYARPPG
jgi:predicted enzyme related to lactoylglutathione lyase